ncbi:MAG: serine hydrolase [Pseudomonadota bacterium]|nr:serine hydrolase [Pseudomonadota bacterium]
MVTAALGKRVSALWRGLGLLSAALALSLAPLAQASAQARKPAATAKAAPKSASRTASKAAPKAPPKAAARPAPRPAAQAAARNTSNRSAPRAANARPAAAQRNTRNATASNNRAGARANRVASGTTRVSATRPVAAVTRAAPAPRLSMGQQAGLRDTQDPLELRSSVALVLDQDTHEVLFSKNDHAVLPIASLTKLMTGLIVADLALPLDELITITHEDVDTEKGSSSRLAVGTTLTRGELMHLALMSSENRAAHALGRTHPGGMHRFVAQMNARAIMLGMKDTRFVEPTGLSSANRSSAHDLAMLVQATMAQPLLRQFTTSHGYEVAVGDRVLQYNNTNRLVFSPDWHIGLQKTGYISEAGRCLVMQASVAGRKLIMVFLDSSGTQSRLADAERIRRWVEVERPSRTLAQSGYAG